MYISEAKFPENSALQVSAQSKTGNWFAVFTRTHHEKCVARHLNERGIENFLPLYKAKHEWTHRRKVTLDLPLFPNYLFVNIVTCQRIRTLEIPGVVSLVGKGRAPSPLPDGEIEGLQSALKSRAFEPHPFITQGNKVRIKAGPLAGRVGLVIRKKNDLRVVLTVEMIMQCVSVEVDADEVEPCTISHQFCSR